LVLLRTGKNNWFSFFSKIFIIIYCYFSNNNKIITPDYLTLILLRNNKNSTVIFSMGLLYPTF
jgi:hypothetical protein